MARPGVITVSVRTTEARIPTLDARALDEAAETVWGAAHASSDQRTASVSRREDSRRRRPAS
jgi:hypothetical protein